jgi:hypothetical protein
VTLKALNLEKFLTADKAGRGVVVPKQDDPPEKWVEYFKKAGVPEKSDGYKLPGTMATDPIALKFRDAMHKAGMPPQLLNAALEFYSTDIVSQAKALQDNHNADLDRMAEKDLGELRQEWQGLEYDKNVELGRRAAKSFIPHKDAGELEGILTKMENALGTKFTMKLFANIGGNLGEHAFVQGDPNPGSTSAEAAKLKIAELKKDVVWSASFAAGDVDKRAEWDRLHKIAHSQ